MVINSRTYIHTGRDKIDRLYYHKKTSWTSVRKILVLLMLYLVLNLGPESREYVAGACHDDDDDDDNDGMASRQQRRERRFAA